jgi:hypothetical protein
MHNWIRRSFFFLEIKFPFPGDVVNMGHSSFGTYLFQKFLFELFIYFLDQAEE